MTKDKLPDNHIHKTLIEADFDGAALMLDYLHDIATELKRIADLMQKEMERG